MSKINNPVIFDLIKRMTKSEKRRFTLFASRSEGEREKLFVELFEVLEKMENYDDALILKKIPRLKRSQLSNIKAHLLKHLMSNLRHLHIPTKVDIQVRDLTDNARVYYSKGMYRAALSALQKAKKIAKQHEMHTAFFNCVEFEKKIEGQHITGSMYPRAEVLSAEVQYALSQVVVNNQLSNLALRLYGIYLKQSYIRHQQDYDELHVFFKDNLPDVSFEELDFYGKLYYLQSHVWFCITVQDFSNYFKYSFKWVDHYEENDHMIEKETAMYLKGIHNLLNAYFIHQRVEKFYLRYEEFSHLVRRNKKIFDLNCWQIIRNIEWIHGCNVYILNGDFDAGANYIDALMKSNGADIRQWNLHRLLTIYYKIACIYFGAERLEDALGFLNFMNNRVYPDFRNDIQCFSRILSLIIHFDLGNMALLKYQVKSVYRFLLKLDEMQMVQKEIFNFLKMLPNMKDEDLMTEFGALEKRLIKVKEIDFERRAFLYLDIIAWLRCKIENRRIQEIIQRNLKDKKVA